MAKTATKKPAAPKSLLRIIDVPQGSQEWREAHIGVPSASMFHVIMAQGRDGGESLTRKTMMNRMAGEIITGQVAEDSFKTIAMKRGNALEAAAVEAYARRKNVEVKLVGFGINFEGTMRCGASPDGLVGFDGGVECKTMRADLLIPMLSRPAQMLPQHVPQVQGNMLVFEREWWDLTVFADPALPALDVRVYRDEPYLRTLHNEIERFNWELSKLVDRIKKMGVA